MPLSHAEREALKDWREEYQPEQDASQAVEVALKPRLAATLI